MSRQTIRRKDKGEAGNGGLYSTMLRGESAVEFSPGSEGSAPMLDPEQVSEEDLHRRTARIPTAFADKAEREIEKANRRLEREGIAERFEFEREDTVTHRRPTEEEILRFGWPADQTVEERMSTFVLNRPSISQGGWTFGAVMDRIPGTDDFTMRTAHDADFAGLSPEPGRCDHCGQFRERNRTFLITNDETGETMQVGSSCIEPFLGIKPSIWHLGFDLRDGDDEWDFGPLDATPVSDNRELIAKALAVSDGGSTFVSRSRAEEWGKVSTADAMSIFAQADPRTESERREALELARKYLEDGTVDKVLAAAQSLDADSDYGRNMHLLLKNGYSPANMESTLISAIAVYRRGLREKEREAAQIERQESAAKGFIAPVKERIKEVPMTVTNVYEGTRTSFSWPYDEEPFQIITMRTQDGHEAVWKTGSVQEIKIGEEVGVTGTVKAHSHFRGVDQTDLTRASLKRKVRLAEDGFPVRGPFEKKALGRAGKKIADLDVRIEGVSYSASREVYTVTGRTRDNLRVQWLTSEQPPLSGSVKVSGAVNATYDQGHVKHTEIRVDDSTVIGEPDPNRMPDMESRTSSVPLASEGERIEKQWVQIEDTERLGDDRVLVYARTRDNQRVSWSESGGAEREVGSVGSVSGVVSASGFGGDTVLGDEGLAFSAQG